jgi:Arc/MetJ-type ribon-helix-helix transcriptional regulator
MIKTTVYLPEELEVLLDDSAAVAGVSKAEAIRQAIALWISQVQVREREPRRLPVFSGGRLRTAEEMDEQLVEHIAERAARR